MKKRTILSIAALSLFFAAACQKSDIQISEGNSNQENRSEQPARVKIEIAAAQTKTTLEQSAEQDNKISKVEVFVFKNTDPSSSDYHQLDTYQSFAAEELSSIEVLSTTGPKIVCVVANSHNADLSGITNFETFKESVTSLQNEKLGDFTMYGEATHEFELTNTLTISLSRFVSRIGITSVKTKFDGTSYQGQTLTNCKLFLVNANGEKLLYNGGNPATPVILNEAKLVDGDVSGCAQEGLLVDDIAVAIEGTPYITPHYFYAYSNETQSIANCTKLVLQADLAGVTYYYPILINQADYGYQPENGHYGVGRNNTYSYSITVTRAGSNDPNTPLVAGSVEITLNVEPWNVVPHFDKEF